MPSADIASLDTPGSITPFARDIINGKQNSDVSPWFGHLQWTPAVDIWDRNSAVERYLGGTNYFDVSLKNGDSNTVDTAVVRFSMGGECIAAEPGTCIPSARTYYGDEDVYAAVCHGPGNNGIGEFGEAGKSFCSPAVDDVCAMLDGALPSSLNASRLCPAPHTRCVSASSLGR